MSKGSFDDQPESLLPTGTSSYLSSSISELSLEQQFIIRKLENDVKSASMAQLQTTIVELYRIMLQKENMMKSLLAQHWGIQVSECIEVTNIEIE